MMTSGIAAGGCTSGPMGTALPPLGPEWYGPGSIGVPTPGWLSLPLCIDQAGHRFAIGLYHKDRACCERCGLIREAKK